MGKIKILISSRPQLLSDVIRNMIDHQPDMEMVGEVIDPLRLISTSWDTPVDAVIITPLKAKGESGLCRQLLEEKPLLKIITLSAEGDAAYLYRSGLPRLCIDEPSARSILGTIRDALILDRLFRKNDYDNESPVEEDLMSGKQQNSEYIDGQSAGMVLGLALGTGLLVALGAIGIGLVFGITLDNIAGGVAVGAVTGCTVGPALALLVIRLRKK